MTDLESIEPSRSTPDALEAVLRVLRHVGLIGFLGGLASLSALWAFGPKPQTIEQWDALVSTNKVIFFSCSFTGIVILVVAGLASWWRKRRELHQTRWFRLVLSMLAIAVPGSHLWARTTAERLYAALERGDLDAVAQLWDQLGLAYVVSLTVMTFIAAVALVRPRMGQ